MNCNTFYVFIRDNTTSVEGYVVSFVLIYFSYNLLGKNLHFVLLMFSIIDFIGIVLYFIKLFKFFYYISGIRSLVLVPLNQISGSALTYTDSVKNYIIN